MTELDRLNTELYKAKVDMAFWRSTYDMFPTDDNFNSAVIAHNIVSSVQQEIIELLLTR
jgi:hypothetical protein